jgi:N-acetylglutamate synthase-like GNAT family acetyltransferase
MAPTIRPAKATDQSTIRRLIRSAGLNPLSLDWPNFVVAEDGGEIVGIGQVKTHRDGSREVASIAVVPSRQGEGIGTSVINALLDRHGAGVLYLTCQGAMQGYYERFGFRRLSRREFPRYFARLMPVAHVFARLARTEIIVMRR